MRQEKLSFLLRKLSIRFYGDARIMPLLFRISVLFPEALLWARLLVRLNMKEPMKESNFGVAQALSGAHYGLLALYI